MTSHGSHRTDLIVEKRLAVLFLTVSLFHGLSLWPSVLCFFPFPAKVQVPEHCLHPHSLDNFRACRDEFDFFRETRRNLQDDLASFIFDLAKIDRSTIKRGQEGRSDSPKDTIAPVHEVRRQERADGVEASIEAPKSTH